MTEYIFNLIKQIDSVSIVYVDLHAVMFSYNYVVMGNVLTIEVQHRIILLFLLTHTTVTSK